jgi:hypothetical protein
MGIFTFMLAAVLSLPKQFITVYIGVMLESDANSPSASTSKIIGDIIGAVTLLVTVIAMWYINKEVGKVKPQIIQDRQKFRYHDVSADNASREYSSALDDMSDDARDDMSCETLNNESHPEDAHDHAGSMPLTRTPTLPYMPDTAEGQRYRLNTLPGESSAARTGGPSAAQYYTTAQSIKRALR